VVEDDIDFCVVVEKRCSSTQEFSVTVALVSGTALGMNHLDIFMLYMIA